MLLNRRGCLRWKESRVPETDGTAPTTTTALLRAERGNHGGGALATRGTVHTERLMNVTVNTFILAPVNFTLVRFVFVQFGARFQAKSRLKLTVNRL